MSVFNLKLRHLVLLALQAAMLLWSSSVMAGAAQANPDPPEPCPDGACCSGGGGGGGGGPPGYGGGPSMGGSGGGSLGSGMPVVLRCDNVHVAIRIRDTPLLSTAAVGPATAFTISYYSKSRAAPATTPASFIGPVWRHNWQSWIDDDPSNTGNGVKLYYRDGGYWPYSGYRSQDGTFTREDTSQAQLVLVSASPIVYERRTVNGGKEVYAHVRGNATANSREVLLTAIVDPHGNQVALAYDGQDRLASLTDATGRVTRFSYDDAAFPALITGVQDFAGRSARLTYNSAGELASITDVLGLTSTFAYTSNTIMTAMTTPYGTTHFVSTGDSDANRTLTVTDPLGGVERYEFASGAPGIPFSVDSSEIPNMPSLFNSYINYRSTFYWDKTTMAAMGSSIDYNKAYIRHWSHDYYNSSRPSSSLESEKKVGQSRIWYRYQNQGNAGWASNSNLVTMAGRKLADGTSVIQESSYNSLGNLASFKDEVGNTKTITYAANQIDPTSIRVTAPGGGQVWSASYQYNAQHLPTQATDGQGNSTTYQYNARGQVTQQTNPDGGQISYAYDAQGQLITRTDPTGGVTRTSWDSAGRIASVTDPRGLTRTYSYDHLNRITRVQYSDGASESYVWNKLDLVSSTDRYGRTRTYQWDANRRLTRSTNAYGTATTYAYDRDGRVTQIADAAGTTSFTYRADGSPKTITQPSGYQLSYTYDAAGRRTAWADNRGNTTTLTLDAIGNLTQQVNQDSQGVAALQLARAITAVNQVASQTLGATQTTTFAYDGNGDLSSETNGKGESQQYGRDTMRRVASVTNPLNAQAVLHYNGIGATIQVQDFKGITTNLVRNAAGDATQESSADIGSLQAGFDVFGRTIQLQDAAGRSQSTTRDALGQATRVLYGDNTVSTLLYDAVALLSQIKDPGVTTNLTRDSLQRLTGKNQAVTLGGRTFTHNLAYSWVPAGAGGAGQLQNITYPSGKVVSYRYDATGQLIALGVGNLGLATQLTWTPLGMPKSWTWPFTGGVKGAALTASRSYNTAGQLASSEIASYDYDAAGRLTQVTQKLLAPALSGTKTVSQDLRVVSTIGYDAAGRVTSFTQQPDVTSIPMGAANWPVQAFIGPLNTTYQWDANGNRTASQSQDAFVGAGGLASITRDFNFTTVSSNRTESLHEFSRDSKGLDSTINTVFQWDASGRMTGYKGDQLKLNWNAAGQLAGSVGRTHVSPNEAPNTILTSYVTNLLAQRVGKQSGATSTVTVYGDDEAWPGLASYPLATYVLNSSTGAVLNQAEYYYLPTAQGPMPVAVQLDTLLLAVHTDHLNTPRRLSGNATQAAWQWPLSAFGETEPGTSVTGWVPKRLGNAGQIGNITAVRFDLRYPGQQQDEETGLFYNHNRYYDPYLTVGYTEADPLGLDGGWNRFSYVGGNPLNFVDLDGLNPLSWAINGGRLGATGGSAFGPVGAAIGGVGGALVGAGIGWYITGPMWNKAPDNAYDPNGPKAPGKPGEADGFKDPKGGENWVPNPNPGKGGSGYGWQDVNGDVWCPTGQGGNAHGGPHWDVQTPGGGYRNVRPQRK